MSERKRLKTVRRRNTKVNNHNFATKTLKKVDPIYKHDSEKLKKAKQGVIDINKQRRIERNESNTNH